MTRSYGECPLSSTVWWRTVRLSTPSALGAKLTPKNHCTNCSAPFLFTVIEKLPDPESSPPSPSSDASERAVSDRATPGGFSSRRAFLKVASVAAVSAAAGAAASCNSADNKTPAANATPQGSTPSRVTGFDRATLDAVGDTMLPASLGDGRRDAVNAFVAWIDGYEPVAEEMHGYGYADVRYLPPDPAPAWRAQLDALDLLAKKTARKRFHELDEGGRKEILTIALARVPGGRLPAPLAATHVAVALVAHWSASPRAWNAAFGADISPNSCRTLDGTLGKPRAVNGVKA